MSQHVTFPATLPSSIFTENDTQCCICVYTNFVSRLDTWILILILILNGAHLRTERTRPLTLTCKFCTHYVDYQ